MVVFKFQIKLMCIACLSMLVGNGRRKMNYLIFLVRFKNDKDISLKSVFDSISLKRIKCYQN